jgi:dolichol-phosphate mannosyltransferase
MIAVIVPTLNEEPGVAEVVQGFPESYRDEVIEVYVIDGGSADSTVEEAREAGAVVMEQRGEGGKGDAVEQALNSVEADYYVLIDGDGTYEPGEVGRLLDPLMDGEAGHVVGVRSDRGNISAVNRMGNRLFNVLASLATGRKVTDMLSGYRAMTAESLRSTPITRPGFGVETEITLSVLENGVSMEEVEVSYSERMGESKLRPGRDGWRILKTAVWSVRDLNPLKFFSFAAVFMLLVAAYPSFLVFEEKLVTGRVQSLGPVVFSAMCIILAVQLLIFGLLADQLKNVEKRLS